MKRAYQGSVTIFLALTMLSFLTFCMVLVEGVGIYYLRAEAVTAMELAEYSVLSEYQKELLNGYGLFFLDLDYEQGQERIDILESRARTYLEKNAEAAATRKVSAQQLERATDGGGAVFFRQAVACMKQQTGYGLFEELLKYIGTEETPELSELLEEQQQTAQGILDGYAEEKADSGFQISLPDISFPSVKALTRAVFGDETGLSSKEITPEECIQNRALQKGTGKREAYSAAEMQLFHGYILKNLNTYTAKTEEVWKDALEYQVEYVIAGQGTDRENLENVMWRIFLLRAAGNYLFFHQDPGRVGAALSEATALVGFTGNTALIKAVQEIFLISQAVEEGIAETRQVFLGEKVPLYENGLLQRIELGYEEYLYIFLNTMDSETKIYRCMDVIELEVRHRSGYEGFRLDHCTDCFTLCWEYQFSGILLSDYGGYETTMTRKVYYEI